MSVKERAVGHVDQVRYRALSLCRALWRKIRTSQHGCRRKLLILLNDIASVRSPVAAVVRGPVQALGRSVPAARAVVH